MILFLLGLGLGAGLSLQSDAPLPITEVLTASELRDFNQKPAYITRTVVMRKALDRLVREVALHTKERKLKDITFTLSRIDSLADYGLRETRRIKSPKGLKSKPLKRLEIRLRKAVEALEDLKLAVPFEYRVRFEATIEGIEAYRNRVLKHLFGESISSQNSEPPALPALLPSILSAGANRLYASLPAAAQARTRSGISGDQFTDLEYESIQDAQKLLPRVKAFLAISESRLQEIERRIKHQKWDKEEPNPLEFYTQAQLLHAYQRALEGVMVNIDEKAKYKTASQKEIQKSLKLLNKKVQEFLPRLKPLKQLAIDGQDEELYREFRLAAKATETALKGSQMGLGAPVGK